MTRASGPRSLARTLISLFLRIGITGGVFAYLFTRIDLAELGASLERISAASLLGCLAALGLALATAIVRWRLLLSAYGASRCASWLELTRLYFISLFYNLLPGAVGGDVLRGYAAREYFADGSATRSVGVVLVDRVLGFSGLLVLASLATLASPLAGREILLYSALGLGAAASVVTAIPIARRLSGMLPKRLARIADALPQIVAPRPFALAAVLSVGTHLAVTLGGHAVIHGLASDVHLLDSMWIFPIGALAAYFPLTVAGAGARDAALVFLFARIGVARSDALASSLALLFCTLALSAIGGLLHARAPLSASAPAAPERTPLSPRA